MQDIADSAYRYSRGRPQLLSSVSKLIADTLFSVLVQALFLVQVMNCTYNWKISCLTIHDQILSSFDELAYV
jgi:etoposide-induced 2.4 mRNA